MYPFLLHTRFIVYIIFILVIFSWLVGNTCPISFHAITDGLFVAVGH